MMVPLINPCRTNKKHSARKYARGHGVSGSIPSTALLTKKEAEEYFSRLKATIKGKHLKTPKGHTRMLKRMASNPRRSEAQIATRKARAAKGLAFKSADLALDRKILKELKSLKSTIKGAAKSGPHESTSHSKESAMAKRRKRRNPTKKGKAGYRKLMAKGAKSASQYRTRKRLQKPDTEPSAGLQNRWKVLPRSQSQGS
jgi:hypothetical protein